MAAEALEESSEGFFTTFQDDAGATREDASAVVAGGTAESGLEEEPEAGVDTGDSEEEDEEDCSEEDGVDSEGMGEVVGSTGDGGEAESEGIGVSTGDFEDASEEEESGAGSEGEGERSEGGEEDKVESTRLSLVTLVLSVFPSCSRT